MPQDKVLDKLHQYESELAAILGRFVKSRDALRINRDDASRLHQIVIELRDLLDDELGPNNYASMIVTAFNDGQRNFIGSSSWSSVDAIKSVVSSVITRVKNNPDVLLVNKTSIANSVTAPSQPLPVPERVTLHWLHKNVPVGFWVGGVSLLAAAFTLGATLSHKFPFLRELLGLGAAS